MFDPSRALRGLLLVALLNLSAAAAPPSPPTAAEVLASSLASDWRRPDPERTLYIELPTGRVVIELAPAFAPNHVANIQALVRQRYFDGLAVVRAQDNYVVQWADPDGEKATARPVKGAQRTLRAEFFRTAELPHFWKLNDGDPYAGEVGIADGWPVARDPASKRSWLVHCYGMVGAGRDEAADSGGGTELYAVIGHAPRHLDRNVTLVGRVVWGMELFSTLRRGTGALGFYESAAERTPIVRARIAADLPPSERTPVELLRTDTPLFERFVAARRHRAEKWFVDPVDRIEVCNVPLPARLAKP